MKHIYDKLSAKCSRYTTRLYSTSFSLGIFCMKRELREPIYSIYGFVRLADEIVDSFDGYDKQGLLQRLRMDTQSAIESGISLNPILHSFQGTVRRYSIEKELIDAFLMSMEMDLEGKSHDEETFKKYIFGSAEVVGLMCLRVFCKGNNAQYDKLKPYAMSLGSAFQKINFLRDLQADFNILGRSYFPNVDLQRFNDDDKKLIEKDIARDFQHGYEGIRQLPGSARLGVYVAYVYYMALFKKIRSIPSEKVLETRIRIPNGKKAGLLAYSIFKYRLDIL